MGKQRVATGEQARAYMKELFPKLDYWKKYKNLDDNATYLGNQIECEFGGERCFGIVANMH